MRFIVKNFGPIKNADITLDDMNVFIGPGGTGKSYLAYLIWMLLRLEPKLEILAKEIVGSSAIKLIIENIVNNKEISVDSSHQLIAELMEFSRKAYEENIETYLKDTFRINDLADIIYKNEKEAIIKICNNEGSKWIGITINRKNARLTGFRKLTQNDTLTIKYLKEQGKIVLYVNEEELSDAQISLKEQKIGTAEVYSALLMVLVKATLKILIKELGFTFTANPYILTDSKSGILRLAPSLIRYTLAPEKSKEFPLNLPDREMLSRLVIDKKEIRNEKISKIADFIENEIGGTIDVKATGLLFPEISFNKGKNVYPIIRSHSGARELAPFILYLRYVLEENKFTLVEIEEPETHLHPSMQSIATRAIALLSKHIPVLITTHSPITLDELNNLIKLNKIIPKDKIRAGYKETEGIDHKSVRIYRFKEDGTIENIKIDKDGIYEEEFSSIVVDLSNKYALVEELLWKQRHGKA